ncbi:MAG: RNA methyltransferase [Elusimicrobia bacterium]|nr:RNA methyltransferase [Elusimicrobiota bacterium]
MHIRFVLVRPRDPVNIGSAARAMANFGFSDLAVVAPYEPIWREAVSAVGAEHLLKQAKTFATVQEATADCHLVLGTTTGRRRVLQKPVITSPELPCLLAGLKKGEEKAAILFGSEKTGLSKNILDGCNYLVTIPTEPLCPSMNLAQAVVICSYELSKLP